MSSQKTRDPKDPRPEPGAASSLVSSRLESERDLHERDTWESNKTSEEKEAWGAGSEPESEPEPDVAECQQ